SSAATRSPRPGVIATPTWRGCGERTDVRFCALPVGSRPVEPTATAQNRGGRRPVSPLVVLVGPPGAGKSTVGERLAERLGVTLRDTDADIEAATGTTIAELFVDHGEA